MNRLAVIRSAFVLAVAVLALAAPLLAQNALEIIDLRHRTAEQVLPALRPLLEPGATLSGQANRLIVRASPANIADLRLALEALDRPARRLQISVRFDGRVDQRVQVLEGSRAVIYSGRSRPARQLIHTPGGVIPQQVTVVHDQATGFEVIARLSGKGVRLEIAGQRGSQYTGTTVEANLGQWIELGNVSSVATYRSELQGVWLKVEERGN